jgi:hypothetical protein
MLGKIESGITEEDFEVALSYSKKYGLLSNDAIHVATMTQHGITNIATKHFLSTRKISPYWACGVVGQSPTLC